jgi:hypothetical protein
VGSHEKMSKNNRRMILSHCAVCGGKKSMFVATRAMTKSGAGYPLEGLIPELHLPGHNFTGPGTKLKKRLLAGSKPANKLDEKAMFHDMAYSIFKDNKSRHVFDKKLQDEAYVIQHNPKSSLKEKLEAGLVKNIMFAKRKLGV